MFIVYYLGFKTRILKGENIEFIILAEIWVEIVRQKIELIGMIKVVALRELL